MLIFGHPRVPSETLYHIDGIDAIAATPSNSTVFFECLPANDDIIAHCRDNGVPFAAGVTSVKEALFAENLGARFILVESALARSVQKIAETYLFDAKILARIDAEDELEAVAYEGIDGVIFPEAIVKVVG